MVNSLTAWRYNTCSNFKTAISEHVQHIKFISISCEFGLRRMPWNHINDTFTLVQVMTSRRQETNHRLSQCWPRFMSPYCVRLGHDRLNWTGTRGKEWIVKTRPEIVARDCTWLGRMTLRSAVQRTTAEPGVHVDNFLRCVIFRIFQIVKTHASY